ncbi:MAG TPA: TatD family hydrolase [Cytophagaceae bacterium]|jgi:TatD DNase family protein
MPSYIDSHSHIYSEEFDSDRAAVIKKCLATGVSKIYMPNVDRLSIPRMLEVEASYPGVCIPMIGLHPCYVKENFEGELQEVETWLAKREFAAVGEVGLDFYWDMTFRKQQEAALMVQADLAVRYDLPLVIHCRNSIRETIELLKSNWNGRVRGIFHCFSGNLEEAKEIISMGFYLGIGGVATFKNGGLDRVLPDLELSHLVLETDSPYLAPVPYRGKRNESSYIPLIAEKIAALMNSSVEEVALATTKNVNAIFKM